MASTGSEPEAGSDAAPSQISQHDATSHDSPAEPASLPRTDTGPSTASIDSSTVLLNPSHAVHADTPANPPATHPPPVTDAASTATSDAPPVEPSPEPKKCWICFADETEDTPLSSAWRTPCPCALTAHEGCLLEWVKDLDASRRGARAPRRVECPQCKGEIKIVRPPLGYVAGQYERTAALLRRLVLPGYFLLGVGGLGAGAWVHGALSIYLVAGPEDFHALFHAGDPAGTPLAPAAAALLVPVGLVTSQFSLGESLLPILPVVYFATTQYPRPPTRRFWPPSPMAMLVCLPYVRGIYTAAWSYFLGGYERKWIAEVVPAGLEGGANANANGGRIRGIELEVQLPGRPRAAPHNDDAAPDAVPARLADHIAEANEEMANHAGDDPDAADADPAVPANHDHDHDNPDAEHDHDHDHDADADNPVDAAALLATSAGKAQTVLGSLCFPAVAAAAGELLRVALPGWAFAERRTGLMATRWGRSLVGGCLFVVVRDTIRAYYRYRAAVSQRERKVLDFKGRRALG